MANKCVIYLDGVGRGIVLTNHDQSSIDELTKNISDAMAGNSIFELKTRTDRLIVRPNQVTAIHIQNGPSKGSANPKIREENNIKDIIPELDLGDVLEVEVGSLKDELETISDEVEVNSLENEIIEDEKVNEEIIEEANEDEEDSVISEVNAWHSEIKEGEDGDS